MTWGDPSGRIATPVRQDQPALITGFQPRLSLVRATSLLGGLAGHVRGYAEAAQSALPRGHGVAAEHASHLIDWFKGRVVSHLGSDNVRCGPDRSVDGVLIQTKFCSSGRSCIAECFDESGFRYRLPDGKPMQIEVPRDLHSSAVQAMESRIARGQVPGVSDPAQARSIVRRGLLTYEQARRLGRAGSRESLMFDAVTGLRTAILPAVFSAGFDLVGSAQRGKDIRVAVVEAVRGGARSAGTTYVTHILTKQTARTALDRVLAPASEWIVTRCGPKATRAVAAAAGRRLLVGPAATSHVAKMLRGNVVSAAATGVVMSSVEVCRMARGRSTGGRAAQNILSINIGLAGGTVGWIGGVAVGGMAGSVVPFLGTGIGAFAGGALGSIGGNAAGARAATSVARLIVRERPASLYVSEDDNFVVPTRRW